jgi:hypothetical protein
MSGEVVDFESKEGKQQRLYDDFSRIFIKELSVTSGGLNFEALMSKRRVKNAYADYEEFSKKYKLPYVTPQGVNDELSHLQALIEMEFVEIVSGDA